MLATGLYQGSGLIKSIWGSWGCSFWREGGSRETSLLSTTPWEEVVTRWRVVSFPTEGMTGNSLKLRRGDLDWILQKTSSWRGMSSTGPGCPEQWWGHILKVFNGCVDVALGTWFNGGLIVGINDLFQTKQYNGYMILWKRKRNTWKGLKSLEFPSLLSLK